MKTIIRSNWERAFLVCGKCSGKLGGGFGPKGRTPLAKALRTELGIGKGRKARIGATEVKCLGVCPKRAVMAIDSADVRTWHMIPAGADIAEVARTLLGDAVGPEPPGRVALAVTNLVFPDQATAA
ncbi:(2Fe-2S) ferredoxin domain-containing protein [uncultured Sphingomonas sp.]|uniref:(2Fe-2S) ferredoxin domain-containing protein n=1 Tax=uncultured Sphingomonas sp. TaxID=158754 RepID=UPI0035C9D8A1